MATGQENDSKLANANTALLNDIRTIIEQGRKMAYAAAGQAAIATYWNVGRRIVEEEQSGQARAEYGAQLIPMLAEQLTREYGHGYGRRNLAYYKQLYLTFRDWEILHELVHNLTWTHLRRILSVANPEARDWYLRSASENMWSTTELDRNISTQYFERRLAEHLPVNASDLPKSKDNDPLEYIKNPVVAEL